MTKISTIKEAVLLCGRANITPFIWGYHGCGKSSLVKQLAIENNMGFIDLRCAQLEASDIRGLPEAGADGRTHYLPPADMPVGNKTDREVLAELAKSLDIKISGKSDAKVNNEIYDALSANDLQVVRKYNEVLRRMQPHFECGILFLDEVNRAQDDVQQAVFELVLDKSVGSYVLPPGWIVVAAGNFMEGYMVAGFTDPAFLDRFCHLTLSTGEQTLEEWVNYMADTHGEHAADIIEFASHNIDHLDGKMEGEIGFNIQPSRRSWEMVTKLRRECENGEFSDLARTECYAGLIGRELALSFSRYSCPIKPGDLIANGVAEYTNTLKTLDRNQLVGVMWGLVAFCKQRIDEDVVADVCIDFAGFMAKYIADKDIVVAFCRALVDTSKNYSDRVGAAALSNPKLASMISQFNKKGGGKKTFIDRLAQRPELQDALSRVSWGVDGE